MNTGYVVNDGDLIIERNIVEYKLLLKICKEFKN
jgi:hypothetical protein